MPDTGAQTLKAVVTALKANEAVSNLVGGRVFNDVPQNATFPYVLVELRSEPFAADDFSAQMHRVRVHCYSRAKSQKGALEVRSAVHAVLDRQEHLLSVAGASLVKAEYSGLGECIPEDDGATWDAMGEFELWVM